MILIRKVFPMTRKKKEIASIRNVRLRAQTYERLEKFKVELIQRKGKPQVTFDDAVNYLLDEHYGSDRSTTSINVKT